MVRKLLILMIVTGIALLTVTMAFASVYNGTVDFTCTGADATSGSHVLDRDNTGVGQERLRIDITDGYGTVIFTFTYQNTLTTFGGGIGNFTYSTPPAANPLTFTLTSLAGNGLPEQVDYVQQGTCAGLPTAGDTAACPVPLPAGSVVYNIPAGALAFFEPRSDAYTGFDVPPGTWYVSEQQNGYAKVWIACQASMVWVPVENIVGLAN